LSVVITMREQVDPSAIAQPISVKFITNENAEPPEILIILKA